MAVGAFLFGLGGMLLAGAYTAITRPDAAKVTGVEMTKPLLITVIIFSTLLVYSGYAIFGVNLLAAASVLQ